MDYLVIRQLTSISLASLKPQIDEKALSDEKLVKPFHLKGKVTLTNGKETTFTVKVKFSSTYKNGVKKWELVPEKKGSKKFFTIGKIANPMSHNDFGDITLKDLLNYLFNHQDGFSIYAQDLACIKTILIEDSGQKIENILFPAFIIKAMN